MSEQPDNRPDDRGEPPAGRAPRKRGRLRPLTWLGTLSTVVAVATGMFTLRDQILPSDSGNAMASETSYEQSIAHVCDLINQTTSEQPAINTELAREARAATTALAQRDAVLSAWKQDLGDSERDLEAFEGLDPPGSLRAQQRTTDRAWNTIVTQMRLFVEQLETTNGASGLRTLVSEIPALDASVSREDQTRNSGLVSLGDGDCTLSAPLPTPIVTLPLLTSLKAPTPETHGNSPMAASPAGKQTSEPGQPTPPVNPASAIAPVNPPTTITPPANPPASPTPPVTTPSLIPPTHLLPGTLELAPSASARAASAP